MTPLLRADSGFTLPTLYDICDQESVYFVIYLESNIILQRLVETYHPSTEPSDFSKKECYFEETIYQAKTWSKPRKIIIKSVHPAGELFFHHAFYVTNLVEAFKPEAIVRTYQKRGTEENYIKEAKNGFGLAKMNRHAV